MTDDTDLWLMLATAQWSHRSARKRMRWDLVPRWRRHVDYLTTRLEDKR